MASTSDLRAQLHVDNRALLPELTELRGRLHRQPEIGLQLPVTQRMVLDALQGLPLDVSTGRGLCSVTAVLRGAEPGPAVLLRGDMDALPVRETPGAEFTSENDGVMHACGHDLHTAGLVGAARLLAARRADFAGSVVFMFQPGEEYPGGAQPMIDEGVLDAAGERVVAAYGLHVFSSWLPLGTVACRSGTAMAAADSVRVTVHGRGGHGSMPHLAADPVTVVAEIVLALQTAVTRQVDVFDPVVLTVGRISAGTVSNVIPETAVLDATVRTFSEGARARCPVLIERVCSHVAAAHGLTAIVAYEHGYPPTVNDSREAARATRVAADLLGEQASVQAPQPLAGAEDFAYVLREVAGAFVFLGACPPELDPATAPYNHAPGARFSSAALAVGPALLAALALDRLSESG